MSSEMRECKRHGLILHHCCKDKKRKDGFRFVCKRCMGDAVSKRQRKVKAILVQDAGGSCRVCGYDRYQGALQFHHVDPTTKLFNVQSGVTKALATMRSEAAKCVLLCANCHAEVENGMTACPELLA